MKKKFENYFSRKKKGFTLIELVVVIAIMAILALIMVPNLTSYLNKADDSRIAANSKTIHTAAELVKQTSGSLDQIQIAKLSNNDKVSTDVVEDSAKAYGTYYVEQHGDKIVVKHVDKTDKLHIFPIGIVANGGGSGPGDVGEIIPPDLTYVAKDTDFEWVTFFMGYNAVNESGKGYYRYIGSEKEVKIPDTIKGTAMTNYYYMFQNSNIEKVVSSNNNVTVMARMFEESKSNSLNLSSLNTSNVTSMTRMFASSEALSLDLTGLNTTKVIDMSAMFENSKATSLNLTSFNTTNVRDMSEMFVGSKATTLDLSSFDTSNATMNWIFDGAKATVGYARTQTDANKFNSTDDKPAGLTFTIK